VAAVKRLLAVALSLALATPATAAPPCLTAREVESIALVAMPEIVRVTGTICANRLPANSLIRRGTGPFLAKYQAAADRAWPDARMAVAKLSDPSVTLLLASDFARPVLVSMLVPLLVGRINTADCPTIDRLTTLLEPLPPRNTAGIIVTTLQFLRAEKAKGSRAVAGVPDLPVCAR
jgi:hypothetical protein